MMNQFAIGKRIGLVFAAVGLLLILTLAMTFYGFHGFRQAMAVVNDQNRQLVLAKDTHNRALQAMVYIAATVATGQDSFQPEIQNQRTLYASNLDSLGAMTHTEESRRALQTVKDAVAAARDSNTQAVQLATSGKGADAAKMFTEVSLPKLADWNAAFDQLDVQRKARMAEALGQAESQIRRETWLLATVGGATLAAVAFLAWALTRSIVQPIHGFMGLLGRLAEGDLTSECRIAAADEIGQLGRSFNHSLHNLRDSLREVEQASRAVASGAVELSAAAEEMSATTQEIARGSEVLHGTTDSVSAAMIQFMTSVDQVAGNVKSSVAQTGQAVSATEAGAAGGREAAGQMERIRETSGKISKAVVVIKEIAQQTNLLSLNAAIEAAKAGEQGKGFAVVAEEVRKLADRSRQATVEIEQLINETQEAVHGGVQSMHGITELMERISRSTADVSGQVREIGSATQEQSATAVEITRRLEESAREVGQNAAATHQLSATVQEISRTAADLAKVSEAMTGAVGRFRL